MCISLTLWYQPLVAIFQFTKKDRQADSEGYWWSLLHPSFKEKKNPTILYSISVFVKLKAQAKKIMQVLKTTRHSVCPSKPPRERHTTIARVNPSTY